MLMRRWERARQGDGQLVLIVGEPGLGKSRLIEEFHSRLRETPHTWSEWSCSQLLQNTPFHPIAEWGRKRFGASEVPGERRLVDLESTLAQVKLDPAENVPLLAPLLEIPLPKDRVPNVAPEELRRRQLAALTNWVIGGAKTNRWYWFSRTCNGPIQRPLMCCAALRSVAPWPLCLWSRRHDPSFGLRGACARITQRFRLHHSTANRCGT